MPDALARLAQLALVGDETTILEGALREAAAGVDAPLVQILERGPDGGELTVRASLGTQGEINAALLYATVSMVGTHAGLWTTHD